VQARAKRDNNVGAWRGGGAAVRRRGVGVGGVVVETAVAVAVGVAW